MVYSRRARICSGFFVCLTSVAVPRSFLLRSIALPGGTRRKGNILADVTREPRAYELMAVFVPELSDEELVEQIERVTKYITDQQGVITEVLRESPWGRRRLAYTIRFNSVDYRDGIYVVYHFDNVPSGVFDIERELKLDVRVMRYLLVHDDPLAGEKDTGQNIEGEDAETDGEASADAPVAAAVDDATTEVAEAAPVVDEAPAEVAAVTPVEEAPAEVAEAAPVEEAAAEVAAVEDAPVEAETEVVEEVAAADEPEAEVEAPAEDAPTSEEETKED